MFNDNLDFYPTPEKLAKRMLAGIDFKFAHTFLEPSAGSGNIVRELKEKEKRQRQVITRMKNEKNGGYKKSFLDENDATRYRNMNIELLKKIRQLKEENRRLRYGNKN